MVLDELARRHQVAFTRRQGRSLVSDLRLDDRQVLLAKPQTYMNLSGAAVGELVRFYQLPLARLLLVFDDIDLPTGTIRLRPSGGSAGQNGAQSVIDHLGSEGFPRLRLGVDRPPGRRAAASYVLRQFTKEQAEIMDITIPRAADAVETFVREGIEAAMNKFNGAVEEQ